jgi:predicted outer membrane protein
MRGDFDYVKRMRGFLAVLAIPASLATGGCDDWGADDGGIGDGTEQERTTPDQERDGYRTLVKISDGEVLGMARALNQGEIDHATSAQGRLTDPGMQSFCDRLIQDHRAALVKIDEAARTSGITPIESDRAREFARDVQEEIKDLHDDEGKEFDEEFLGDQKELHERALKMIDDDLLPAATTPAISQLLDEMRGTIASHL